MRLSEKTVRAYRYDLLQFAGYVKGRAVDAIDSTHVEKYLQQLSDVDGLKPASLRRKLMTLKAFFGFFENLGGIGTNPTVGVVAGVTATRPMPKILNIGDVERLLDYLEAEVERLAERQEDAGARDVLLYRNAIRDRAVIELLFASGMRVGELAALDIGGLNLAKRTLCVVGRQSRERVLHIDSDRTIAALRRYKATREPANAAEPALFLNRFGGRLSIFAVENIFDRARKAAGIRRRVTPHVLRHTLATMLLNSGRPVADVQDILGHSSSITTHLYGDIAPKRQKRLLENFDTGGRLSVRVVAKDVRD